jgi:hypothetical protein
MAIKISEMIRVSTRASWGVSNAAGIEIQIDWAKLETAKGQTPFFGTKMGSDPN